MGWSFAMDPSFKKADQVAEFRRPGFWCQGIEVLDDAVVNNNYWAAIKLPDGRKIIALNMMKGGGRSQGWGYKGLTEDMGPVEVNCPVRLLNMTDEPSDGYAVEWRRQVRAYAEKQKARREARAKLKVGDVVRYGPFEYQLMRNNGRLGWSVKRMCSGVEYRMKATQINQSYLVKAA